MKKILTILLLLFLITLNLRASLPYKTLYLEYNVDRYQATEETEKFLAQPEKYEDKLNKMNFIYRIWVDIENKKLFQEEENQNHESPLIGRLKINDKHYELDYSIKMAIDYTEDFDNKIYDNFTTAEPDYIFYKAKMEKKVLVTCLDGVKRKAKKYTYLKFNADVYDQAMNYIETIKKSDLPDSEKAAEISETNKALHLNSRKIIEYIWTDGKEDLAVFLKKIEYIKKSKLLIKYNLKTLKTDIKIPSGTFDKALSGFRIAK